MKVIASLFKAVKLNRFNNLFFISAALLFVQPLQSQSSLFSFLNNPPSLTSEQTKVVNYATNLPHKGAVRFVEWGTTGTIGQNGILSVSLPEIQNGQPLTFQIYDAVYNDPAHYSVHASGSMGYVNVFVTPEGKGGTIDLITRTFTLLPVEETKSVIIENDKIDDEPDCGISSPATPPNEGMDFCEGDCGAATVDVLLLRTPQANTWLSTNWGWLSEWFLFVESHNINVAFANSGIPNKRVRFHSVNYTPTFLWSTNPFVDERMLEDVNNLANSQTAQFLMNLYRADIVVMLTNNNYTGAGGTIFGIVNNPTLDPMANNMFAITQVANIDPSRFTLAHEIGHHFGCRHSIPLGGGCPHGKNMDNGKNTIMANQAPTNTRIPYFSNPDIEYDGEPTGDEEERDNAQQIRAAFCEVANNFPDPEFSVSFSKPAGPVCPGETLNFTSTLIPGDCPDPFGLIPSPSCGIPPYQYEWRVSTNPAFTNSQIVGTNTFLNLYVQTSYCSPFYVRLTVTSSNGLVTTATRTYSCAPGVACEGKKMGTGNVSGRSNVSEQIKNYYITPNPTHGVAVLNGSMNNNTNIECFNLQGISIPISYKVHDHTGVSEIDLENLPAGLYLLKIAEKDIITTLKLVID